MVRVCELYLRKGGRFALVLPNAAIDREHYAGFRTGTYNDELPTPTISAYASKAYPASVVTSKAASCGHLKSGQLDRIQDKLVIP